MSPVLKLIPSTPPPHTTQQPERPSGCDSVVVVARVFDAWRVLHRHDKPVQPRMTDQRRNALLQALAWGFDEDALMLAVEGCKASAFCQWKNRTGHPIDELTWIVATAERIERLANEGAAAREAFEASRKPALAVADEPADPEVGARARARLGEMRKFYVAKLAGGR